jgi:hypothetical protein
MIRIVLLLFISIIYPQQIEVNLSSHKNQSTLFQSTNNIPLGLDKSLLSNIYIQYPNKSKKVEFISNIFTDGKDIDIYEMGIKLNFMNHVINIGKIKEEDSELFLVNNHIVFNNRHEPIEKITIRSKKFINLPFFKNNNFLKKISFSYNFTNGLLDENYMYQWDEYYNKQSRAVFYSKSPRIHIKNLFVKYAINTHSNFTLGLNHAAIWGGTVENLYNNTTKKYSNSLKNLHKVIFWQGGGSEYDRNDIIGGVIGNHLGSIDFIFERKIKELKITVFYQHIFEDGGSFWFDNKFDGLWAINFTNNLDKSRIKQLTIEFLNTKYQSGDIHPNGVDSYFWHDQYPVGWQYEGLSMGSMFMSPSNNRMKLYFLSSEIYISNSFTLKYNMGHGNIYNYYGYKGWDEPIGKYIEKDFKGTYSGALLTLNQKIDDNFILEYYLGSEKNIDLNNQSFGIKVTKLLKL